jgi:hypothetical protein
VRGSIAPHSAPNVAHGPSTVEVWVPPACRYAFGSSNFAGLSILVELKRCGRCRGAGELCAREVLAHRAYDPNGKPFNTYLFYDLARSPAEPISTRRTTAAADMGSPVSCPQHRCCRQRSLNRREADIPTRSRCWPMIFAALIIVPPQPEIDQHRTFTSFAGMFEPNAKKYLRSQPSTLVQGPLRRTTPDCASGPPRSRL